MKATKALLVIIFLTMLITKSKAQGIVFGDSSLAATLTQARKVQKPIMLFCYASWCTHCKYMKEQVLNSPQLGKYFNDTYICIQQDMEIEHGPEMNKLIQIHSYPTFIFYNAEGTVVYRIEGEYNIAQFLSEGKNALNPKQQLPYLHTQFESDSNNPEKCYNYLRALKKAGLSYSEVVDKYFLTQTDHQLLSETNWRIFTNGISDIHSRIFRYVIAHQKEYCSIASADRVRRKFVYEVKSLLSPLIDKSDTAAYRQKRIDALSIGHYSTDSLVYTFDLMMWGLNDKWVDYRASCLAHTRQFSYNNQSQLADITQNFLKHFSDTTALEAARKWAKRALVLDKSYDNLIRCAQVEHALGEKKEALRYARDAEKLARKYGWEGTDALKLIKENE